MGINKELDQTMIKEINRKKIIGFIKKNRSVTRQEISKELDISLPTITNNINELIEDKIIIDGGFKASTGGRRAKTVEFNPESRYSIGVEIEPGYIRIILCNLDLELKYDKTYIINKDYNMDDNLLLKIEDIINIGIKTLNLKNEDIIGIGISIPGVLKDNNDVLKNAPNLKLRDLSFEALKKDMKIPIYIENEANAGAYSELDIMKPEDYVYISIKDGLGSGVVIDNKLYKGSNNMAGELGHMTVVPNGKRCNCGSKGCLEMYTSARILIENYNIKSSKTIDNLNDFGILLNEKDLQAIEIWDEYIGYLSLGLRNIDLLFDPNSIIIGGNINDISEDLIKSLRSKKMKSDFLDLDIGKVKISKYQKDASIIGAATIPLNKFYTV